MNKKYYIKFWWMMLLRGIIALTGAIWALFWTQTAMDVLIVIVGFYLVIDGIFAFVSSIKIIEKHKNWWVIFLEGLIQILMGSLVLLFPVTSILIFVYFLTFWLIVTGILEIWAAYTIDWGIIGRWIMIVIGILSLIIAIIILTNPLLTLFIIVKLIGVYLLIFSIGILVFTAEIKKNNFKKIDII